MLRKLFFVFIAGFIMLFSFSGCFSSDSTYDLEVSVDGEGEVKYPSGPFSPATVVDLEVIPEEGWDFSEWQGPDGDEVVVVDPEDRIYSLKIDEDKEITAVFEEFHDPVYLTINIEGNGTVDPMSGVFERDEEVTLSVEAQPGNEFDGWGGQDKDDVTTIDEDEGIYSITMEDDRELIANFIEAPLTVPGDFETIQEAINAAEDGDRIIVSPGTYKENINFSGKNIILTSTDPLDKDIVITTIIDGDNNGPVVTFENNETKDAVLEGFTITGGSNSHYGGGFIIDGSSPTIQDNLIRENSASRGGGALVNNQANPTFERNLFENNLATSSRGSTALYVVNESEVTVIQNTFKDHVDGIGVIAIGVSTTSNCSALIQGNIIKNNTTDNGVGGITVMGSDVTITSNQIFDNEGTSGGAITISRESTGEIKENEISDNTGEDYGAIVVNEECSVSIKENLISHNQGEIGGGIAAMDSLVEILDNEITNNISTATNFGGGGILVREGSVTIDNNEINNNQATNSGGGIYLRGHGTEDCAVVLIKNNNIDNNLAMEDGSSCGGGLYIGNIVKATIYGNNFSYNTADLFGGGIYVVEVGEVPIYGENGLLWDRVNSPPENEEYNTYGENKHGNDECGGVNVFFRENCP